MQYRNINAWELGYAKQRRETNMSRNYRADDLLPEESEEVLLALKRLPQKEAYDRVFRLRRAVQVRTPLLARSN